MFGRTYNYQFSSDDIREIANRALTDEECDSAAQEFIQHLDNGSFYEWMAEHLGDRSNDMQHTVTIDIFDEGSINNLNENFDGAVRDAQEEAAGKVSEIAECFIHGYLTIEETCREIELLLETMRKLDKALYRWLEN